MSYLDFIAKTTSEKTVLIDMDLGKKQQLWYNHQAYVWAYRWRSTRTVKNIGDGNIGDGNIGAGAYKEFIKIGSCFINGVEYTKQANLAAVENVANEESWYYDETNFIFYIHCEDHNEPQMHRIIIGTTIGLSNKGGYYGGDDIDLIDRGDCESLTPPMVFDETVPVLYNATFARDIAEAHGGTYSYKVTKTVAPGDWGIVSLCDNNDIDDMHGIVAGRTYTWSIWVYVPVASGIALDEVYMQITDYDSGWEDTAASFPTMFDTWQKISVTRTIRSGATGAILRIGMHSNVEDTEYFYIDDIAILYRKQALFYEPRLKSVMTLNKSKDPLFFGIIRHDGGQMSFINSNEFFDNIKENVIFGQPVSSRFGGSDLAYTDYQYVNKSYIDDLQLNFDEMSVSVIDNKKKLSVSLPVNKFDQATYTDLDDDDIGKVIPLGYGEIYHAPVTCINAAEVGVPDRVFKVCDIANHTNGIEDIVELYKVTDNLPTAVSSFTKQLTAGTATITNADWDDGAKYICDYKGIKNSSNVYLQNPLDIIADMLSVFLSITYNSTNYNDTEWDAATANDLANNIGLFINKEKELTTVIEEICNCLGSFIVQDNGKFTFRILDVDEEPKKTIFIEEMIGSFDIEWDGSEFLTSANIGYKRDWNKKSHRWYYKGDLRDEIYSEHKKYSDKSFETLLTNETDAQECAVYMMGLFRDIPAMYTVRTKTSNVDVEIMDMMNFEINRVSKSWFDFVKVSVINITKNLINNTATMTGQHISKFTGIYFRYSPYAINVDRYAINIPEYALSYGRLRYDG